MSNLVKFNEILDWGDDRPTTYGPAYIDIDKIQYICPHADGNPKHCTVTLEYSWTVGLDIDMDHLASLVNKAVSYPDGIVKLKPEQLKRLKWGRRKNENSV